MREDYLLACFFGLLIGGIGCVGWFYALIVLSKSIGSHHDMIGKACYKIQKSERLHRLTNTKK